MVWQSKLLRWYRKNRRDLPWRRTRDPYKIWVSEIMLQQTTVEAVIPYYERFLKKFPTLRSLAESSEEEVLQLWSGLGYYSRARNLLRAALTIDELPRTAEELQKLPGIGRYTAGAIASIAFGARAPILDGNVIRVLSRLFVIEEDPKSSRGQKVFWKKAEEILPAKSERRKVPFRREQLDRETTDGGIGGRVASPPDSIADFNQALMELGATVCLPDNPLCPLCPVSKFCRARQKGSQAAYPRGRKKTAYRDVIMTAAVIRDGEKILMIRRPKDGLLKGMWEVPMVEGGLAELCKRWPIEGIQALPLVRHSVLNRRLKILPVIGRLKRAVPAAIRHQWILASEIGGLATSSMNKKIFDHY